MAIMALGLIGLISIASAAPHHNQGDDWLPTGGDVSVHHTSWDTGVHHSNSWHTPGNWHYITPVYYGGYTPYYYSSLNPWWVSNVHSPFGTTYYH